MARAESVDPAILQARLQEVRNAFQRDLPQRAREIVDYWEHLTRQRQSREALEGVYRVVHNLAGAGGTFGYDSISAMARQVADPLRKLMAERQRVPTEAEILALADSCEELVRLCRNPDGGRRVAQAIGRPAAERPAPGVSTQRPVYLLGDGADLHLLAARLGADGTDVHRIGHGDIPQNLPTGLLVADMASLRSGRVKQVLSFISPRPPLVVLSQSGDFDARLEALREGADAFLVTPVDFATLERRLQLLASPADDPYRVLIVDDDPAQARYAALVLEHPGIQPRLLHDPRQLIGQLQAFSPHLILLDLYMPGCSGTELARMVRQYDPASPVSMLFLSVEQDRPTQLAALQAGADDFLTKPIVPDELAAAVWCRLGRVRALRRKLQL